MLERHLAIFPEGKNRTDYAFLMIRARRGTGPMNQHLAPAGHVPVYPYFDLDHIRVTMEFDPLDKLKQTLQSRCLEAFWPKIFAYPSSRRYSKEENPEKSKWVKYSRHVARMNRMRSECRHPGRLPDAREVLQPRHYLSLMLTGFSNELLIRWEWWVDHLLTLLAYQNQAHPCWSAPRYRSAEAGSSAQVQTIRTNA
jgi:hypothetical protein